MENKENFENLDEILKESKGFTEIPAQPKTKPAQAADPIKQRPERIKKEAPRFMTKEEHEKQKAMLKLVGRIVSAGLVAAGSAVAEAAGLMDVRLALPLGVAALAFAAFWLGAGIQWKFGGLLDG